MPIETDPYPESIGWSRSSLDPTFNLLKGTEPMTLYINFYTCNRCNLDWDDEYDHDGSDQCPKCDIYVLPWQSEECEPEYAN